MRLQGLVFLAFLAVFASSAQSGVNATPTQKRFEELYSKAYSCYARDEYVCAAYHFAKVLDFSEGIPSADLQRINIDFAYSLYLIGKMDGAEYFEAIFKKEDNLRDAKDAIFTAGYGASYIDLIVTMELIEHIGVCNDKSETLIDELHFDLGNEDQFPDKSEFDGAGKGAILDKSQIILDQSTECHAF